MEGSASSSSGSSPGQSKRKRNQVPHDVISTDGEDDPDGIVGDNIPDQKNKQPVAYAEDWQNKTKDALTTDLIGSSTYKVWRDDVTVPDIPESSDLDLINFNNSDGYEDDEFDFVEDDNVDFAYENYLTDNDLNSSLAAKLDDLDLPAGVEASVSWLQKHDVRSARAKKENTDDEIERKYKAFKQFDTVQDSLEKDLPGFICRTLFNSSLKGFLVPELGLLDFLQELYVINSSLSVPAEIGDLTSVTEIDLHSNGLTGGIPLKLWNLANLVELRLDRN